MRPVLAHLLSPQAILAAPIAMPCKLFCVTAALEWAAASAASLALSFVLAQCSPQRSRRLMDNPRYV
eukprot:1183030-Prorocentrum_minimum.AAC.1